MLAQEYRKVIENHPSTILPNKHDRYDDTDFLSKMFAKEKQNILGHQDSSEQLIHSDSQQALKQKGKRSLSVESKKLRNKLRAEEKPAEPNAMSGESAVRVEPTFKPASMFSLLGD